MRDLTFATWMLMTATFCMTAVASVGVYQSLFVMPEYFSSPPASLRRYQADRSWTFWLPLHAVTLPALVLSLISTWSTERRGLVLGRDHLLRRVLGGNGHLVHPGVIESTRSTSTGPIPRSWPPRDVAGCGSRPSGWSSCWPPPSCSSSPLEPEDTQARREAPSERVPPRAGG